jgi:hypothetical protein
MHVVGAIHELPLPRASCSTTRKPLFVPFVALLLALALAACDPVTSPHDDPGLAAVTLRPTRTATVPAPATAPGPALVTATPADSFCTADEVARILRNMPPYTPGDGTFVELGPDGFTLDGAPFVVRGVNYYPARAPWQRFVTASLNTIEADFGLLRAAHVNTVRLFVRYDPFFVCPGSGAVPDPRAFLWLDAVIRLADAHNFRVILALHDLPDTPLYTDPGDTLAQTAFIIARYRDEPAILAWDLRDSGDADYTPLGDEPPAHTREQVLDWLARTAAAVRQLDTRHPITAGWAEGSEVTSALVDVVSFQHFGDAQNLRQQIAALRALTDKPLLLIAFGASTFERSDTQQAQWLRETVRAAEGDDLAGWLVWTMYDFPVEVTCWPEPCASFDDIRHHYGLWRPDGERKPAANALETLAGAG